eukprot:1565976-Rhodomonas_salina.2
MFGLFVYSHGLLRTRDPLDLLLDARDTGRLSEDEYLQEILYIQFNSINSRDESLDDSSHDSHDSHDSDDSDDSTHKYPKPGRDKYYKPIEIKQKHDISHVYLPFAFTDLNQILLKSWYILKRPYTGKRWTKWIIINLQLPTGDCQFTDDTGLVSHVTIKNPAKTHEDYDTRYKAMLQDSDWTLPSDQETVSRTKYSMFESFYYTHGLLLMRDPEDWLFFNRKNLDRKQTRLAEQRISYNRFRRKPDSELIHIFRKENSYENSYENSRPLEIASFSWSELRKDARRIIFLADDYKSMAFIVIYMYFPPAEYKFQHDGGANTILIQDLPTTQQEYDDRYEALVGMTEWQRARQ